MKSFKSIPGPRSWPIIGNLKDYVTKKYDPERLQSCGLKKYAEFGPVVKEKVFGGLSIVWLFHPDDIKTLFENEGKYPSRRSHLALKKYRKEKPEFYNNGGLLPTNGPEWARMRKAAQKPLTKQLLSNHIQVIIWDIEFAPS